MNWKEPDAKLPIEMHYKLRTEKPENHEVLIRKETILGSVMLLLHIAILENISELLMRMFLLRLRIHRAVTPGS